VSHSKRYALLDIIKSHKPHILLVCETKLKALHNISFRGYKTLRLDRTLNQGGGLLILIRENIQYSPLDIPALGTLEVLGIEIPLRHGRTLHIFEAYNSCRTLNSFRKDLNTLLRISGNNPFIIGGDINARHPFWGDYTHNHAGSVMFKWFPDKAPLKNFWICGPDGPTFQNARSNGSYLDLFVISSDLHIMNPNNVVSTLDYPSNHNMISIEIPRTNILPAVVEYQRCFE